MATYKKQLVDKDGNIIIPDIGINLDDVVYSDDPTEVVTDIIDPNSYSLDEKWTGGYWIDNKKIYKKTINFGALPNNDVKGVNHDISNLDQVIKLEAIARSTSPDNQAPLPYSSTSNLGFGITLSVSSSIISIRTGYDRSGYSAYVTIYYTKSS